MGSWYVDHVGLAWEDENEDVGKIDGVLDSGVTTLGASATRQVTYYLVDPQGTPLATMDAAGQVLASNDYSPYGREVMEAASRLGIPVTLPIPR